MVSLVQVQVLINCKQKYLLYYLVGIVTILTTIMLPTKTLAFTGTSTKSLYYYPVFKSRITTTFAVPTFSSSVITSNNQFYNTIDTSRTRRNLYSYSKRQQQNIHFTKTISHQQRQQQQSQQQSLFVKNHNNNHVSTTSTTTTLSMSFSSSNSNTDRPMYMNIGKEEMEEIIEDYDEGGRIDSEYVIIDVRTDDEVITTGKLSPNVYTLPIQTIIEYNNVFDLSNDDFKDICGFDKPTYDETIVFTCKAGIRSVYACQYASKSGYTKLINYMGGSSEWFATGGRTNRDI
jgi:rhodanese-related sulfurtransferase